MSKFISKSTKLLAAIVTFSDSPRCITGKLRVGVVMDDDLHKELKHYAVNQDKSITDIIVGLVKKELETKKEQSR